MSQKAPIFVKMMEQQKVHNYPWGDQRRYFSYSRYFKILFGGRMQKVTIDAGFTCPNRDGSLSTGGCTFCNNDAFNPSYCQADKSVQRQIEEGMEFHAGRYGKAKGFLAYFQAYSNTYKPLDELRAIYDQAMEIDQIQGLVIGTRPDCIDEQKLDYFARLSRDKYVAIEYGVESVYDKTLARVNRGHTFETARRAIQMTAERGIHTGAHFILGLPGESEQEMLDQVDIINELPLHTVKFHQLQIFKDTLMAHEYEKHPDHFRFFELAHYIDFFIELLTRLRPNLVVERFAGEAPPRFHVGPSWGMVRNEQLLQMLEKRLQQLDLWQGCRYSSSGSVK